jgi:LacI family transcriptional regulator
MISSLKLSRICGVSQGTVDRALHDRPGISEKTKRRILEAAARHGYLPHPAARELLTGTRLTIGALVPTVNSMFFMDLMNAIREPLAADGFRFFVAPVTNEDELMAALDDFAARRARAVVAVPPREGIVVPAKVTHATTVISLTSAMRGTSNVHSLVPDEVRTGRDAAAYLVKRGHARILHLTYERDAAPIHDRAKGYAAFMRQRRLSPATLKAFSNDALLREIERCRATALFCHNDWLALTVIRILEASGLRVPEDVSVMGVDDSPTFVSLCPDVTTMHYPDEDIARAVHAIVTGGTPRAIGRLTIVERRTVSSPRA